MTNLLYFATPVALVVVGSLLWMAQARRPRSMEQDVREFSQELGALAPGSRPARRTRRTRGAPPG